LHPSRGVLLSSDSLAIGVTSDYGASEGRASERGAGKSFDRSIPPSSMTVEQFISDLDELVDAVCRRLGKPKVAVFGHSWGSALGVLYAARFPEKVAPYVGSGQIGAGRRASRPPTRSRSPKRSASASTGR
jgi:pimeloyl-ACP methyl ester carboxylesterase